MLKNTEKHWEAICGNLQYIVKVYNKQDCQKPRYLAKKIILSLTLFDHSTLNAKICRLLPCEVECDVGKTVTLHFW